MRRHSEVTQWLVSLGLAQYAQAFRDNDIGFDVLSELNAEDLEALGVSSLGNRKRLLKAIESLAAAAVPGPAGSQLADESIAAAESRPLTAADQTVEERRQLTVAFYDLVGSTSLANALDPEDFRSVVRRYHGTVSDIAARYGGYVAQFLGDGVLVYFGYPSAHEDDAERAVRASLDIVAAVTRLESPLGGSASTRVGIATGLVVLDRIGAGTSAAETGATGETPNLAARLQAAAPQDAVVVSERTHRLLGSLFQMAALPGLSLKGLPAPVDAWQVIAETGFKSRYSSRNHLTDDLLVGRGNEQRTLLQRWNCAIERQGQAMLIAGEAGHGKSRLCQSFIASLPPDSAKKIEVQCSPLFSTTSLFPFKSFVLNECAIVSVDDPVERGLKLAHWLEPMRRAGLKSDSAGPLGTLIDAVLPFQRATTIASPREIQNALLNLFDCLATRPTVLLVEDLHWIDSSSEELIAQLLHRSTRLPILTLLTCRPNYLPTWDGAGAIERLVIRPLSDADARSIAAATDRDRRIPASVLDAIVSRSDGVPLFVEEITRAVLDAAQSGATLDDLSAVPMTLQDSLTARLDRLKIAKRLAQMAAAIGREFRQSLLNDIADSTPEEVRTQIEELFRAGLIDLREEADDLVCVYRHALIRDAAYASMTRVQRSNLHARIAGTLAAAQDRGETIPWELKAHHLEESGQLEAALKAWQQAADRAFLVGMNKDAAAHCRRALGLYHRTHSGRPDHDLELELQTTLSNALLNSDGFNSESARQSWSQALKLSERGGSLDRRLSILNSSAPSTFASGRFRRQLQRYDELSQQISPQQLSEMTLSTQVGTHLCVGVPSLQIGHFENAREAFDSALKLLSGKSSVVPLFGGVPAIVPSLAYALRTAFYTGRLARATALIAEMARLADELSNLAGTSWCLQMRAWHAINLNDPALAVRCIDRYEPLAVESGLLARQASAVFLRGLANVQLGDVEKGSAMARIGLDQWHELGGKFHCSEYAAQIAGLLVKAGADRLAADFLDFGEMIQATSDERFCEAELMRLRGELASRDGDSAGAIASVNRALEIAQSDQAWLFALRSALTLHRLASDPEAQQRARHRLGLVLAEIEGCDEVPEYRVACAIIGA